MFLIFTMNVFIPYPEIDADIYKHVIISMLQVEENPCRFLQKPEAIKIPQQQADLLSTLLRLPPNSPVDAVSRLVLKDRGFCDRLIDVVHPRRPPNVDDAMIHEGFRDWSGQSSPTFCEQQRNASLLFGELRGFDEAEFGSVQSRKPVWRIVLRKASNTQIYLKLLLQGYLPT